MELTRNFSLQELIKSDTAIRLDINNNPNSGQIEKLKALCENILQPVRDHFGRVKVTSGFRSEQLCLAIKSSVNSQHAKAEAQSSRPRREPPRQCASSPPSGRHREYKEHPGIHWPQCDRHRSPRSR